MMRTYNLLGVAEQKAGRLAEARAWYEKSRELAVQLQDQTGLGQAAQNIGIVCQQEGEAARERGDEPAARRHFEEARRSVEESLQIEQARNNKPAEASSLEPTRPNPQSPRRPRRRGTPRPRSPRDPRIPRPQGSLDFDYNTLSEIAQGRGDAPCRRRVGQETG